MKMNEEEKALVIKSRSLSTRARAMLNAPFRPGRKGRIEANIVHDGRPPKPEPQETTALSAVPAFAPLASIHLASELMLSAASHHAPLTGADVEAVRSMMLNAVKMLRAGQHFLDVYGPGKQMVSTRAGFLMALDEIVGLPINGRDWREEWVDLNQEVARLRKWRVPELEDLTSEGKFSVEKKLASYDYQVQYKLQLGWTREDAEAHVALSGLAQPTFHPESDLQHETESESEPKLWPCLQLQLLFNP